MILTVLILVAVIAAVHWWEYRNSVQEYTFAQPATLEKHDELRSVLAEKTPVAVEIGALPWRPEVAEKSAWTVTCAGGAMTMPIAQWLTEKPRLAESEGLAEQMELTTGLADLDESRAWWWLPGLRGARVDVLATEEVRGLEWVGAERRWVGCSHGAPLTLWLVHSRYRRFLPEASVDPWRLTVAEAPWIGRVQFVEVTVKPGWCIGLPAHWGYAVRGPESWWWTADQHSVMSLAITAAAPDDE